MNATPEKNNEIVVFITKRDGTCADCGEELGNMIRVENDKAYCLSCADLGHLVYLPRGDTALTRRAKKNSKLWAVVVQWSRARKRYERQGLLVEEPAIAAAENECLKDADARARQRLRASVYRDNEDLRFAKQVAEEIVKHYPNAPAGAAEEIAEHACQRSSGRVGRSAMMRELDAKAIGLAVRAHIRHQYTEYDSLLVFHGSREMARQQIARKVEQIEQEWRG